MLIGCGCHCGPETGESSQLPSESASESTGIDTTTGCLGNCIDGVAPVRYRMNIAYAPQGGGSSYPCCPSYSEQSYTLYKRESNTAGLCLWLSQQLPRQTIYSNGVYTCQDAPTLNPHFNGLAFFHIWYQGSYYSQYTLVAGLVFQTQAGSMQLLYANQLPFTRPFNCLSPITLYHYWAPPIFPIDRRRWSGAGTQFSSGPCPGPNSNIPLTLTLTPI